MTTTTAEKFCQWLNRFNGSPFTATQGVVELLREKDFKRDDFSGAAGFHVRNGSSIVAWRRGAGFDPQNPAHSIVVFASHTDSPCLRTRPHDRMKSEKCELLGVSTYGGGLWHTWFDRPLGLAGCVTYFDSQGVTHSKAVRVERPVCIVPNLCIHLQNREDAQTFKPQPEDTLRPVLSLSERSSEADDSLAVKKLLEREAGVQNILSYDLCLYDTLPAQIFGVDKDMINAPGLDNKSSLWATMTTLANLQPANSQNKLIVCVGFDHEEVGSDSAVGAGGDLLTSTLDRVLGGHKPNWSNSIVLSCDAAHGVHPNFAAKHQSQHKPYLNQGTVVKINVNQRYATACDSIGALRHLAQRNDLALQEFVVRNDSPCGSTIGPITATKTGCSTIDVGMPIWAMHSCRETCGVKDLDHLCLLCETVARGYRVPQFTTETD